MNCNKNTSKCQVNTWLYLTFKNDISEEFGNTIPYPHKHYHNQTNITYAWLIDGFFDTSKGNEFLNDIIARFQITFDDCSYHKHYKDDRATISPIKLKYFQELKSRAIQKIYETNRYDSTKDFIFWSLKLHAEQIIREKGIFSYAELLEFALNNFIDKAKDRSTLKAKSKNIFNWYLERDFEIPKRKKYKSHKHYMEETMATRQAHAKKMHTKLADDTKRKVLNVITGIFKDDYKKKDGSWNISKIAKDSGTTRPTVMKYLPKDSLF
jgi:hypothetical protein